MKRRCVASVLALASLAGLPGRAQQCPALVWSDEFSGTAVDGAKWSAQIGDGCDIGLCGWGNNELEYYKAQNATVSAGTLKITAKKERVKNRNYTSARLRTLGLGDWTFGRFEARLKLTQGKGLWPAFWMLPTDEVYGGWPRSGEIDIMENIGHEPATAYGTMHYADAAGGHLSSGASFKLNAGVFADGFHTFALEKQPGVMRWFVDDVLYLTGTSSAIAPDNWPFDQRFHFLLNLAVGGNWPGSPDATTVFPATLEADYVRVYDGSFPYITGARSVENRDQGVIYSIGNPVAGSTFAWSVPAGASIASGQGTNSITVNWGDTGGNVTASVVSACGTKLYAVDVHVEPPYAYEVSFENFDAPANVTLIPSRTTGTLQEVANPAPSPLNSSALSGRYTRSAAQQYDTLYYAVSVLGDAAPYKSGQKRFYLDLYSAAPVGSEILLQLENSSMATASNYPAGRHSRYQAFTGVQNQWQRLAFGYVDAPDPATPNGSVDNLVLLFAPNTFTGDVYTWDNFDSYVALSPGAPAAPGGLAATAVSNSRIDLSWTDNASNEDGFQVDSSSDGVNFLTIAAPGANNTSYSDTGLAAATTYTYRVRAFNSSGNSAYSNTASATTTGGGSPTKLHVASIVKGSASAGAGQKRGTATLTIVDNLGSPVAAATVSGAFSGDFNESASGSTGASGTVTLATTAAKKGTLTFTFCVTGVTHAALAYDPAANVVTCQ